MENHLFSVVIVLFKFFFLDDYDVSNHYVFRGKHYHFSNDEAAIESSLRNSTTENSTFSSGNVSCDTSPFDDRIMLSFNSVCYAELNKLLFCNRVCDFFSPNQIPFSKQKHCVRNFLFA